MWCSRPHASLGLHHLDHTVDSCEHHKIHLILVALRCTRFAKEAVFAIFFMVTPLSIKYMLNTLHIT